DFATVKARRAPTGYASSYVFMTVKNVDTKKEVRLCANYLQFKIRRIAADAESAQPVGLSFWRNHFNETRVCPLPSGAEQALRYNGTAVPLLYRIDDDGTPCTRNFTQGLYGFRNASQFEVDQLKRYGAENAILLLEKGRLYEQTRWHDYLFSDFYDPYINESSAIPTFFLYYHIFQESVLKLMKNSDLSKLQLKFHRPTPELIDFSMLVIWILAVGSVTGGGIWAFFRHRAGKDNIHTSLSAPECSPHSSRDNSTSENKRKCCTRYANFLVIVFLMVLLVGILMIGFFFRTLLVTFFNIMLVAFGTMSVYGCTMAIVSCFSLCECCYIRICPNTFNHRWLPKRRPSILQMIVFLLSLTLCVLWFIYRRTPYAFILLDFINVTLCLHILKSLRLPSLKWITTLMLCMFVYDAVMVFATPYMTRNGCSIMLEVATGIDCSTGGSDGYPIPPIDAALPEKFPMLMQVPHFDPMVSCIDLDIEKGFQMTILGLGDIIIPGYLVTHCFTMGGISERSRIAYGILCSIGYSIGLIVTFFALAFMNMAQPALIYLVPCTLIPICVMACVKGQLYLIWHG
ncbi:hypothetical protein Angca_005872, partial [Angiostrongylus cantonensis]